MTIYDRVQAMDKRLRLMLLATGLLIVPQIGQFVGIRDLNTLGHIGDLGLFFMVVAVIAVPTSAILTGAILAIIYRHWRQYERIMILGVINALIALNLIWFFLHQCSWSQVFGLTLKVCQG